MRNSVIRKESFVTMTVARSFVGSVIVHTSAKDSFLADCSLCPCLPRLVNCGLA